MIAEDKRIQLLLIEDSEDDSLLLQHELQRGGYAPVCQRVDTPRALRDALEHREWDIIISDYIMPRFSGLAALRIVKESGLDLPFIIVSGNIGEDIAVEAMKAGAHDYIIKGNLARLIPAIERELGDAAVRRERRRAEEAFTLEHNLRKTIEESILVGIAVVDTAGRLIYVNQSFSDMVGWSVEELEGSTPPFVYWPPEDSDRLMEDFRLLLEGKVPKGGYELRLKRRGGEIFDVLCLVSRLQDSEGNITGWLAAFHDITDRKKAEEHILATNEVLKLFSETFLRQEYLDRLLGLLEKWAGCSCVGIRLINEGGDIPYAAWTGFDPEFIRQEACLSLSKDKCICPRVINEIPEAAEAPFMSPEGSFFCNDLTGLFEALAAIPGIGFREACREHACRSLAIIPLKYREKVLGALHFAEKGDKGISAERIEFVEAMTPLVGEAIYRFYVEEAFVTSRQQLRDLSAHLLTAREEERTRIAREIHDELGQLLTAASIELSRMKVKLPDQKASMEALLSVSELIDGAVEDVQRICSELRPRVLDHLGLLAAIEWQTEKFSKRSGVRCMLNIPPEIVRLPSPVSTTLFRILQESLTNVARHAGASEVVIDLEVGDDDVLLRIRDNGKGIEGEEISGSRSFGIMGIHERAHDLGGTASFKGVRGKGTTITVEMPLNSRRGNDA